MRTLQTAYRWNFCRFNKSLHLFIVILQIVAIYVSTPLPSSEFFLFWEIYKRSQTHAHVYAHSHTYTLRRIDTRTSMDLHTHPTHRRIPTPTDDKLPKTVSHSTATPPFVSSNPFPPDSLVHKRTLWLANQTGELLEEKTPNGGKDSEAGSFFPPTPSRPNLSNARCQPLGER